jgi:hypothetical protein
MQNLDEQQNQYEDQKDSKLPHLFLFMWDMYGLEHCQDVTAVEKRNMMNALKGQRLERPINLNSMLLRARFNSQRNYEIYTMTVEQGIKESDVIAWFDSNPQEAVDQIRARGRKLYGGPLRATPVIK